MEDNKSNFNRYISQVRYIQQMDDRWGGERAGQEHDHRCKLRALLTPEEILEANRILGWPSEVPMPLAPVPVESYKPELTRDEITLIERALQYYAPFHNSEKSPEGILAEKLNKLWIHPEAKK